MMVTSPVRTLSFASRPIRMRFPSVIQIVNFLSKSLIKARRGFQSSFCDRRYLSCCEYTEPVLSPVSGFGLYPLITRSVVWFRPANSVHTCSGVGRPRYYTRYLLPSIQELLKGWENRWNFNFQDSLLEACRMLTLFPVHRDLCQQLARFYLIRSRYEYKLYNADRPNTWRK
jgi:hypothetical protein